MDTNFTQHSTSQVAALPLRCCRLRRRRRQVPRLREARRRAAPETAERAATGPSLRASTPQPDHGVAVGAGHPPERTPRPSSSRVQGAESSKRGRPWRGVVSRPSHRARLICSGAGWAAQSKDAFFGEAASRG